MGGLLASFAGTYSYIEMYPGTPLAHPVMGPDSEAALAVAAESRHAAAIAVAPARRASGVDRFARERVAGARGRTVALGRSYRVTVSRLSWGGRSAMASAASAGWCFDENRRDMGSVAPRQWRQDANSVFRACRFPVGAGRFADGFRPASPLRLLMNRARRSGPLLPLAVASVLIACGSSTGSSERSSDGGGGTGIGSASNAEGDSSSTTASSGSGGGASGSTSGSGAGSSSGSSTSSSASGSTSSGSGTSSASNPGSSSDSSSSSGSSSGTGDGGTSGKKFVGNISTNGAIRSDFATYWAQFTPENEGKWGSVEGTQGNFNWTALDAEYQYTQSHNVIFKQHNFVWGSQQPSWVASLSTSAAQSAVQTWMQTFCSRFPKVKLIDVVNEPPPHTTPPYSNLIGGAGSSGYDWIVNAFKWARAACPNAILILNDYNTIEYQTDHDHFISIVQAIKAAGAPIDAVGAQGHAAYNIATSTVQDFIDDLATKTGLPVYMTEYDINLANDTQQQQVMQSQFTMFWNEANVKGITLWGYIEGATWQANTGLMTSSGTMRPAMT
jgi:endo-1,4-beta-xylanase